MSMAWTRGSRPTRTTIERWDKSWPTSVMSGRTGKRQARQPRFAILEDDQWLTFNFRKACARHSRSDGIQPRNHEALVRSGAGALLASTASDTHAGTLKGNGGRADRKQELRRQPPVLQELVKSSKLGE